MDRAGAEAGRIGDFPLYKYAAFRYNRRCSGDEKDGPAHLLFREPGKVETRQAAQRRITLEPSAEGRTPHPRYRMTKAGRPLAASSWVVPRILSVPMIWDGFFLCKEDETISLIKDGARILEVM